jgi:hypothetical protein
MVAVCLSLFLLGTRFGYWLSPKPNQCVHDGRFVNESVNQINLETDKWLSKLDQELKELK